VVGVEESLEQVEDLSEIPCTFRVEAYTVHMNSLWQLSLSLWPQKAKGLQPTGSRLLAGQQTQGSAAKAAQRLGPSVFGTMAAAGWRPISSNQTTKADG
jgi:hypothetical protein